MQDKYWIRLLWLLPLLAIIVGGISYLIPAPTTRESEIRVVAERAKFDLRRAMNVVGELEATEIVLEFNAGELLLGPAKLLPKGKVGSFSIKPGRGSSCQVRLAAIQPRLPVVELEYYEPKGTATWQIEARRSASGTHLGFDVSRLKKVTIDGLDEFDLKVQGCGDSPSGLAVPAAGGRVGIPQRSGKVEWSFPDSTGSVPSVRDMLVVLSDRGLKGKLEIRNGALSNPAFVGVKTGSKVVDDKGGVKELGERASYEEKGQVGQVYEMQITQALEFRFSLRTRDSLFDYVSNHPLLVFVGGLVLWVVNNVLVTRALTTYNKTFEERPLDG